MGVGRPRRSARAPVRCCSREPEPATRRDDWLQERRPRAGRRLPQSAVDPVRRDRRPAVHPDDDLRHDLGRPLPAGGARLRLRGGGDALGDGAARLDHRLSAARLHLGPDRPAQAGDRRRRASSCSPAWPGSSTARPTCCRPTCSGSSPGIASGAAMLPYTVIKEANPPRDERHGDRRRQLPQLHLQRAARPGVRLAPAGASAAAPRTMTLEHYQTAFEPLLYGVGAGHRPHASS